MPAAPVMEADAALREEIKVLQAQSSTLDKEVYFHPLLSTTSDYTLKNSEIRLISLSTYIQN